MNGALMAPACPRVGRPMRILFSSLPTHGHTYPLIPLGIAARDAGHDVVFATDASFHPTLHAFGLATASAGMRIIDAFAVVNGGPVDRQNLIRRRELAPDVFGTVLPRTLAKDLEPLLADWRPDLVLHESGSLGAFFAAKRAGIPGLCHGINGVVARDTDVLTRERVAAFADEIEVPYCGTFLCGGGDPYLDIYPASLQGQEFLETTDRIPLRPVPVNEPAQLPDWVVARDRSRPLVYLTLGTAFGRVEVLRQAISGLTTLNVDVLVAAGPTVDVAALGGVPDHVMVEAWVPQADLLPYVDVVVQHGGSGTTLATLAAGKPQLFLPQGADQFSNADAVTTAGAGDQLLASELSAEAVASKVRTLLTEGTAAAAARTLAAEIAAMPSPADTVTRLPAFAGRGGPACEA
jgi:UDP:flavonoid glycosyltransferase YjiC (YdhE family)